MEAALATRDRCYAKPVIWTWQEKRTQQRFVPQKLLGDIESGLRAQLGRGLIVSTRGDLPAADRIFEGIIVQARECGLHDILSRGLHNRSHTAHMRGDYENFAVRFAYEALANTTNSVSRDSILLDLASSFIELGHLSASRNTNLILASTAQDQYTRLSTLINLMYIAALDGHELGFEQYRTSLEQATLPPRLEAYYRFDAARCYRKFGNWGAAEIELRKAHEIAESHKINQLVIEIDEVLLEQPVSVTLAETPKSWSADIDSIASAIGEWRQLQDSGHPTNTEGAAV